MLEYLSIIIPIAIGILFFIAVIWMYKRYGKTSTEKQMEKRLFSYGSNDMFLNKFEKKTLFQDERESMLEQKIQQYLENRTNPFVKKFVEIKVSVPFYLIIIVFAILTSAVYFFFKGFAMMGNNESWLLGVAGGLGLTSFFVKYMIQRRHKAFLDAFPGALDIISRGLKAGSAVERTFIVAAKEIPGPVGEEFRHLCENLNVGVPFADALHESVVRVNISDYTFFIIALIIQRKSGGALSELIENISALLRKRDLLRRKVVTLSSEAKTTGWIVGSLPVVTAAAISYFNPEYLDIFRYDPTGKKLLLLVVGMLVLCFVIVRRMIKFETI